MLTDGPSSLSAGGRQAPTWLAFLSVLVAIAATALESTAVNVTLPSLAAYFSVSASSATWIVAIAQFVIVALLLPAGVLGEVLGYKRVYLGSLAIMSVATLVCIIAPNFETLMAARAFQAVGTAGAMSLGFAMARTIYADKGLGSAIGIIAATVAIASSAGPALTGIILSVADWRGVFGFIFLLSASSLAMGLFVLPSNEGSGERFDFAQAILVAATLGCALLFINAIAYGWPIATLLIAFALALVGFTILIRSSKGKPSAILPLDLLAIRAFSLSVSASVCVFTSQAIAFIVLPFYIFNVAGFSALNMALVLSIWPLATAVVAPILGKLSDRIPAGPMGAAGLLVLTIGFILIAQLNQDATATDFALRFIICGVGFALFQTPNNRLIMLSAPRARSGAASASLSLARQGGRAIGTAIAATALAIGASDLALDALYIAATLALIGMVLSFMRSR
jgi:MFS transporter, DHA2 family, multidrug resistance protein